MDVFKQVIVQGDAIPARAYHGSIVFKGNLYVVMGYDGLDVYQNGMYWTRDGQRWQRVPVLTDTDGNTILARGFFGLCDYNARVYLFGGYDSEGDRRNDVYVSKNMHRWEKLPDAPWSVRYGFGALSFNGRIWMLGGQDDSGMLNEVWWTTDGVSWTQEVNAPWAIRRNPGTVVYGNRMFVIGGLGAGGTVNDVWYTEDGRNWTRMESSANFSGRHVFGISVLNNTRIVISGGYMDTGSYSNEIWHSANGNQWQLANTMPMGNLRGHSMDYFNERLVIVGGMHDDAAKNEVWEANNELFGVR
jgi:N-acetylneuraminic acid mutarotase